MMLEEKMETHKQKIGVLVGGGPAPGINSVIHAVATEAARNSVEVIGILDGFKNLMAGELLSTPLTAEKVAYIYREGGSILHSARANPARSPETLETCARVLQQAGITALVSIGGDDTAFSASRVALYAQEQLGYQLQSVHVPKTIDNDLPLPGDIPTFGYETARELGARLVMNIKRDASTLRHWFLVLSMGRQSGHLALGIGQSASATLTLIPEEWQGKRIPLQQIVDILVTSMLLRMLQGKTYGVAVLAEGLMEYLSHEDLAALQNVEKDEHGHIRMPDIDLLDVLKKKIDQELDGLGLKIKIVKHLLGYELRCAPPCAFDIEYTRSLGGAAVDFLLEGGSNAIITMQHGQVVPIPFEKMINPQTGKTEVRMVDIHSYRYTSAYKFMTRLKPEHAADPELFNHLAALTSLSPQAFTARYRYLVEEK
jgi:6-phosphofructokinase 1